MYKNRTIQGKNFESSHVGGKGKFRGHKMFFSPLCYVFLMGNNLYKNFVFKFKLVCVARVSVGLVLPARKMVQEPKRGKREPAPPSFVFLALAPFFAREKHQKILFLSLSLLPNPTETLARQASLKLEKSLKIDKILALPLITNYHLTRLTT